MSQLSIRQKLYLIFTLLIVMFIGNGIYATYTLSNINDGALRISTNYLNSLLAADDTNKAMSDYRNGEFAIVTANSLPNLIQASQETQKLGDQIDIKLTVIEPELSGEALKIFQNMQSDWSQYRKNSLQLMELMENGRRYEAEALLQNSRQTYERLAENLTLIVDDRKDFIRIENTNASKAFQAAWLTQVTAIVIVILFSIYMAWYISRAINTSINYLMNISSEVATGNLTVQVEVKSSDEFGHLTDAYKKTIENLAGLIRGVKKTSEEVAAFSEQLTASATQSAETTQHIAVSIGKAAETTSKQYIAVNSSAEEIKNMADDLSLFEQSAAESAKSAKQVETVAQNGKASIVQAVDKMKSIADKAAYSAQVITQLDERSAAIGQIVDTISGIAAQTNLLALNAAIEAARAGEQGRGFSVVAEEVRKLAEQSAVAAEQITELIKTIQVDTKKAVIQMNESAADINSGTRVVTEAGSSFEHIAGSVTRLAEDVQAIAKTVVTSAQKANMLVAEMSNIKNSSQEVAAETETVSAATEEQSASMDEIAGASHRLAELAQSLHTNTEKFKL